MVLTLASQGQPEPDAIGGSGQRVRHGSGIGRLGIPTKLPTG